MQDLVIANCISFVSALFTCASCYSHDKKRIYLYQVGQCLILAIANIFFHSYAGIVTLALCAVRNLLLAIDRFSRKSCFVIAALMLILGMALNNNGAIGWIVICANVIYTIGGYFARSELTIKINIVVDLALWIIYEILIIDIPSLIADVIGIVIAVASIIRIIILNARGRRHKQ